MATKSFECTQVWMAIMANMESIRQVMSALPKMANYRISGISVGSSSLTQAVVKVLTRDMTSSIDVRMAPSNGETPNYTSKERLGAVYYLPTCGTLNLIFNARDPR